MFEPQEYQLIDFGAGRKLERFGGLLVDRASPTAQAYRRANPSAWQEPAARFHLSAGNSSVDRGSWQWPAGRNLSREQLFVHHGPTAFELGWTPFGHVGLFPEQAPNWDSIAVRIAQAEQPFRLLNLFAYTGGSTLAAAAAGAEVTHVDASRSAVSWARRNAQQSGLSEAPIRWIVEDCLRYVGRELRRGRQYEAIVLDPPSYGHGTKGEVWQLEQHLPELLDGCARLLSDKGAFVLLTCHTPDWPGEELSNLLRGTVGRVANTGSGFQYRHGAMSLASECGRELPSGDYAWALGPHVAGD